MAVVLNFCINESDDAKSFTVKETTGVYNASTNTGGWGAPNPTIASALTSTITIAQLTDADTNTYTDAVVINTYPTLPNTTETLFEITAEDVGYGVDSQFPDAVYSLTYTVTSSSGSITPVTKLFGLYSNLDCCIKKMADKVSVCTCNCSELEDNLKEAMRWRRLLQAADCCGNVPAIMKFIEKITKLCSNCGCV
jgi:hypothetical protein